MHPFFLTCTILLVISISSSHGQDQGGGSTQVTGLRLRRETEERDLKDLNAAISTQAPGRGRRRRQLFGIKPTLPISVPSLNLNSIANSNTNTNKNKNSSSTSNPVTQLTNSVSSTTSLLNKNNPIKIQAQSSSPPPPPPSSSTTTTTPATSSTTNSEENEGESVTENSENTENPANTESTGNAVNTTTAGNSTTTENIRNATTTESPSKTEKAASAISMLSSVTNLLNKAVVKPVSSLTKTTYLLLTDVQRQFVKVNQDFFSALNFYNSDKIQNNPVLKESVIVKHEGVECVDVCDPQGPGFGLLGLCTPNYCTCFENNMNKTELSLKQKRCRDDQVFDPHPDYLSCRNPADTVLCGDSK